MTFGQQSGPPASAKQVQELLALLQDAGHTGFRDARGALGFTQRQGNGKFTRDEAAALIERLQEEQEGGGEATRSVAEVAGVAPEPRLSAAEQAIRRVPADALAAELRRRGWTAEPPPSR